MNDDGDAQLNGEWVGERMTLDTNVESWHMLVKVPWARIERRDATGARLARFEGYISAAGMPFTFGHAVEGTRVVVLDPRHLLVVWTQGVDAVSGEDIVFSRPGLDELTAEKAYRALATFHAPMPVFYITRWATA